MEYKKLDELLEYIQPTKYIVDSENYDDSFPTPVLTAGKSFILGYTDETNGIYFASKENPIILFDDFTTECKLVDFAFKVKSSACKILKPKKDINIKYVYYAMKNIDIDTALHKRYWISIYSQQTIPFPISRIQENIVSEIEVINETIEYNEHKIKYLEELIKSKFIEMFGDISQTDKSNFVTLSSFCTISSSRRVHASDYVIEGIPFFRSKEIIELGEGRLPSVELFISQQHYDNIKKKNYIPQKDDILMSAVGTIGKMWIVDGKREFYYKDGNILCIHSEDTNSIFLKFTLSMLIDDFKSENVFGSSYDALTIEKLNKMLVFLPDISQRNKFADFVQQIDKSKLIVQQEIKLLNELLEVKTNEYFS